MLVYTADLHLAPLTWLDQPEIRGDAYVAWMQIVDYCLANDVDALLLGGDIFDRPRPDSESVDVFETGLARLAEKEILVYFIQGQHDRAEPPWATALSPLACHIGDGGPTAIRFDGADSIVIGYDNTTAAALHEALMQLEVPPEILVVHQLEKGFVPFEGSWDFDMAWVPPETKMVLAGDYHDPVNAGRLWYSGSTYSTDTTEFGARSFLTVRRSGDDLVTTRETLDKRDVIELSVVTDTHLEDAVAVIRDYEPSEHVAGVISTPLVYAKYSSNVKNALPILENACDSKQFALRTKVLAGGVEVVEMPAPTGEVTLDGCLAKVVDPAEDEKFYSFTLALLRAPKPADVLTETRARLGI